MIDHLFEQIDRERQFRARELVTLSGLYSSVSNGKHQDLISKSIIVLSYAHWEGFYNACVENYINFLSSTKKKVADVSWLALVGCINSNMESMKDKNHSLASKIEFINSMKAVHALEFGNFDVKFVKSQSNLNFDRLRSNLEILNISERNFLPHRNKLDKELVGWRHSVAHGDNPSLDEMDSQKHIAFCNMLLLTVSDVFQQEALSVS
jgi:hypothetical protein